MEARELLAGGPSGFAHFSGDGTDPGGRGAIAIRVGPGDFTMPHGRVILGFALQAEGADGAGRGRMAIVGEGRSPSRVLRHAAHSVVDASPMMLAMVGPGTFDIQVGGDRGTPAPYRLDVFLAGDSDADGRVDRRDLAFIRALTGSQWGRPGYLLDADVDRDGRVGPTDLGMARKNLGASTRIGPLSIAAGLDPSSDPDGNGVVTRPDVVVSGRAEPGALVRLDRGADGSFEGSTTADAKGRFGIAIDVGLGVTPVHVEASDAFGQRAVADLEVTRGDVVIAWNQTLLDAVRADRSTVGMASRNMAMVMAAIYDAVNAIDRAHEVYRVDVPAPPGASPEAAASMAAYGVLLGLYPGQKARFDATLAESSATLPDGPAKTAGALVGMAVADGILAWRVDDGSNANADYTPATKPGHWHPTPPDFGMAWGPGWGRVDPFAIPSSGPFLPPPPPSMTDAAYTAAFDEVKSLGALDSTTRTPEQTEIGLFWAYDRAGLGPPPVLYNQIAQAVALQQGNTLSQNARLFALANIAMADAGMVAWDVKFRDDFWRPITGIREADSDGNPATVADPNWTPLGAPGGGVVPDFTPPFPAYISGHATFGAALFAVLADFYGTDAVRFTIGSDELPGVTRTYDSFSAAAGENGQSRIYLGIHWSFDKTSGEAVGKSVGDYVFQQVAT